MPALTLAAMVAAALFVPPLPARAQQPAPPAAAAPRSTPGPATLVTPQSQINVRVYEGFTTLGPVFGSRDSPLAVDVGAVVADCPDGDKEIHTLDIGGWNYQLGSSCDDTTSRGTISVDTGAVRTGPPAATPPDDAPRLIRCDPATWSCATVP
jgi:hypothetical protein